MESSFVIKILDLMETFSLSLISLWDGLKDFYKKRSRFYASFFIVGKYGKMKYSQFVTFIMVDRTNF
jgi:hypothetical protein